MVKWNLVLSILLFHFLASAQEPMMQVPQSQYMQMLNQQNGNCMGNVSNDVSTGLSNKWELYQQRTNALIDESTKRYEAAKDCRTDLADDYQSWMKQKAELMEAKTLLPSQVRRAELAYRGEVLKLQSACRQSSNTEWEDYRKNAYGNGMINDPTKAATFNETIINAKAGFFTRCINQPENVEMLRLKEQDLQAQIAEMSAKIKVQTDLAAAFQEQVVAVQKEKLRNCDEYQNKLLPYHEALTSQMMSKGETVTKQQQLLGMIGSVSNCLGMMMNAPGMMGGGQSDATTNRPDDRVGF